MKVQVWPVVTYGSKSCTIKKRDEETIEPFEMKCTRKIPQVSWTQKKTNRMGTGGSKSGTRSAQHDQEEEAILLRSHDEERDHAGHSTGR